MDGILVEIKIKGFVERASVLAAHAKEQSEIANTEWFCKLEAKHRAQKVLLNELWYKFWQETR